MFEKAAKNKYRFNYLGSISVEDLFDLSVVQLDIIFKDLNAQKKQSEEESLLDVKTEEDEELSNKLAIVKHIFDVKQAEKLASLQEKERADRKQKILEILQSKQDESLQNMSEEKLKEMLESL